MREHHEVILVQQNAMKNGWGFMHKTVFQVKVPGGSKEDVFDYESYYEQDKTLKYEFNLHGMIIKHFVELIELLQIPDLSIKPESVFTYQQRCVNLSDEVNAAWLELAKQILSDLTGGNLRSSKLLYHIGKASELRKSNVEGKTDGKTNIGEGLRAINRSLEGAFDSICKNIPRLAVSVKRCI